MRVAGPDILLFAVGLLLFSGASYALVVTGGLGGSATGVYDVTYPVASTDLDPQPIANYASATATFTVNQSGVSKVTIKIACTDPVPAGGTFQLQIQVEPPAASGLTVEPLARNCGGVIEIPVEVADPPESGTVQAASPEEALEKASTADANATKAMGDWKVTVNGRRGPGQIPVGVPAGNPAGSIAMTIGSWTVDVKATNPK